MATNDLELFTTQMMILRVRSDGLNSYRTGKYRFSGVLMSRWGGSVGLLFNKIERRIRDFHLRLIGTCANFLDVATIFSTLWHRCDTGRFGFSAKDNVEDFLYLRCLWHAWTRDVSGLVRTIILVTLQLIGCIV